MEEASVSMHSRLLVMKKLVRIKMLIFCFWGSHKYFHGAGEKKALYMSLLLKKFGIMYIISDKKKIILTNSKKEVGNGKRMLETGEYVVSFAGGNG